MRGVAYVGFMVCRPVKNIYHVSKNIYQISTFKFIVGMAKAKQDMEIKNFRDGDCNVIVATSVLLEGIDIPRCNFAINYGMPGNEITFVQARGRVRANMPDDWQYDIIVQREQVMIKERDLRKEKLMRDAIDKVTMKSDEDFKKQVGISLPIFLNLWFS